MSQYRVCIRSVFEKIIGPYEVCIFVNIGPYKKMAALFLLKMLEVVRYKVMKQIKMNMSESESN